MTFSTEVLSGPIGVEVRGLDLAVPLTVEDTEHLRELYATRQLLLFRGKEISANAHVAVCQALGPVVDPVSWVSNVEPGFHPEDELLFHSDHGSRTRRCSACRCARSSWRPAWRRPGSPAPSERSRRSIRRSGRSSQTSRSSR